MEIEPPTWEPKVLDVVEWERSVMFAEMESIEHYEQNKKKYLKKTVKELSKIVMEFSSEIRRLRHKCDEEVWRCIWQTDEDIAAEKEQCKKT